MNLRLTAVVSATLVLGACQSASTASPGQPDVSAQLPPAGQPTIRCGAYEGPDCNDLLELGADALQQGHAASPAVIAVGSACPPNARCSASSLGGDTVAIVIRWPDGTLSWATIPLPSDWPGSPPGQATVKGEAVPEHLAALVR